jgi:hypothetical protein
MHLSALFLVYAIFTLTKPALCSADAPQNLPVEPTLANTVSQCKAPNDPNAHYVWIFKQWHLAPSVNTKDSDQVKTYPQSKNQTAIYEQLDQWIRNKKIKEIYAEGCTGQILPDSSISFNGWKASDLHAVSNQASYAEIVTSVPLKLEAKYGDSIRTVCGDDDALVKENSLAFSDARAAIGFLARLVQYRNDRARAKPYLDGVIQAYKMPAQTTLEQATARMKTEFKAAVERAKIAMQKRNRHLVEVIKHSSEPNVVVVFGGMHAAGIVQLLEEAGLGCSVIEPAGYQSDEENLIAKLDSALKNL